jgi:uncharacterized protein YbjT (DUF2867 family)
MRRAILIGATGLVGSHILRLLLDDPEIESVRSLGRRPSGQTHAKLTETVVDFATVDLAPLVVGDVLFSALGTTARQAGSKEAQRAVDVTHPLAVARAAAKNGVTTYALCSAVGADARSSVFYNRIKGELEDAVQELGFRRVVIARPSIFVGERERDRPMERFWGSAMQVLGVVPGLRKYRPIEGAAVARALVRGAKEPEAGVRILEPDALHALAQ